jgi:hypothetical protein
MAFDPIRIPDNLITAYREHRCALQFGAGASMGRTCPLGKAS